MRVIEAPRLTLEPQMATHAEAMFEVLGDPVIYTYENAPPASVESLRRRFELLESRRSPDGLELWLNWVIRLRSGQLIGYMQATVGPRGSASIGYELGSAHWGRGLAREAAEAMLGELASEYRVGYLTAVAKRANARSIRLLERLGFAQAEPPPDAAERFASDEVLMCRPMRH